MHKNNVFLLIKKALMIENLYDFLLSALLSRGKLKVHRAFTLWTPSLLSFIIQLICRFRHINMVVSFQLRFVL